MLVINWRCALRCPLSHVRVLLGGRRVTGSAITTQLAPRLPAAVGSTASEVMMLGSGEFVMLLLRCCLLLMRWLLVLLLLLRPRGRTGARPMRASSPSVGANSIISSRRNVLLGCTECAVRALSEKVRGGCVHSLYSAGPGVGRVREFKPCRHCEFEFHDEGIKNPFCNLQFAINTSKPPAPVTLEGRLCQSAKPHEYKRSLVWLNLPPLAKLGKPRA